MADFKKYILAVAVLANTIIGVGFFGLPYVAAKAGFFTVFFYFIFLGLVVILMHLLFGEICLRTSGRHRLPGYTEIYLSKKAKILSLVTNSLGLYGALLAYLIVGGGFLADLLTPYFGGNALIYTLIFFAVGAVIIYLGSKIISRAEFLSLIIFFGIFIFLLIEGLPRIKTEYFFTFDYKNLFLPYGIIIFSLWGMSVIPEVKEILGAEKKQLKSVIITGILIAAITYLFFIFLVLGISGSAVPSDALNGLSLVLGQRIVAAGFLLGIIATFTSFLTIGLTLKKNYHYDLKFPHFISWFLACFVPLILYFLGLKNFLGIIGFTGAVTLGIDGILVFLIYLKAKQKSQFQPAYSVRISPAVIYFLVVMFLLGIVFEILGVGR